MSFRGEKADSLGSKHRGPQPEIASCEKYPRQVHRREVSSWKTVSSESTFYTSNPPTRARKEDFEDDSARIAQCQKHDHHPGQLPLRMAKRILLKVAIKEQLSSTPEARTSIQEHGHRI
jgi:hypothetical protein